MVAIPDQLLRDAQAVAPDLWQVLVAIALPESGGDPRAKGDCKLQWGGDIVPCSTPGSFPTSFGYTQFYTDGGLGTGIDPETLMDGPTNLRFAAAHIRGDLAAGKTMYEALQPWSTREEAWRLYQGITGEYHVPMPVDNSTPPIDHGQPADGSARASLVRIGLLAAAVLIVLDEV